MGRFRSRWQARHKGDLLRWSASSKIWLASAMLECFLRGTIVCEPHKIISYALLGCNLHTNWQTNSFLEFFLGFASKRFHSRPENPSALCKNASPRIAKFSYSAVISTPRASRPNMVTTIMKIATINTVAASTPP